MESDLSEGNAPTIPGTGQSNGSQVNNLNTQPVPIPTGADPTPNGTSHITTNLAPPPGIENMPPLSAAAMASFASAARGVTTAAEVKEEGGNKEGLLVLNGTSE